MSQTRAHTGAATIQAQPARFHGALLMCGGLAGAVGLWDSKLDGVFVAKMLLARDNAAVPVINVPADFAQTARPAWIKLLAEAQQTPEGRARIALAAAVAQQKRERGTRELPCPIASRAGRELLSLPLHPGLADADVSRVAAAVDVFLKGRVLT